MGLAVDVSGNPVSCNPVFILSISSIPSMASITSIVSVSVHSPLTFHQRRGTLAL